MPKPLGHTCKECSRVFKTPLGLQMHQRYHGSRQGHHGAIQKPVLQSSPEVGQDCGPSRKSAEAAKLGSSSKEHYICTECGENLESFSAMKDHHHHTEANGTIVEAESPNTQAYICSHCHKSYKHRASLGRHGRIHKIKFWQVCHTPHHEPLPIQQKQTDCS